MDLNIDVTKEKLDESDADKAAAFFKENINKYTELFEGLSNKAKNKVNYMQLTYPIHDESQRLNLTDSEVFIIDLHSALMNAKLIMMSYTMEQKDQVKDKEENKENKNERK